MRWWICGMLFLATVISYVDRQAMAVAAPVIAKEYGFGNEEIARILSAFIFAYAVGQLIAGLFLDWVGCRIGFTLCIAWWSLANALTAIAGGLWQFTFFRFLLGIGESGTFPGGVKVITEWFPARERAFAGGLFTSGASIGAIIAAPLIATLIHHWGWRAAFVVTGSLGFVWVAGWLCLYRPAKTSGIAAPEGDISAPEDTEKALEDHIRWVDLLKSNPVWALVIARLLEEPIIWICLFWLPKYMVEIRSLSLLEAGWALTAPFVALDIGYIVGGWASSRLARRQWTVWRAKLAVMAGASALMTCAIPAVLSAGGMGFVCFISLTTLGHGSWFSNVLTMPADIAPRRHVASVYGMSGLGGALGGILITEATGLAADRLHSFTPVFVVAGFLPLLATTILVLLGGRTRS